MKKFGIKFTLLLVLFACNKESEELKPTACFDFYPKSDIIVGDTIFFANCSQHYSNIFWNFGDQNSSTEISPKHVYGESGTYKIIQTANYGDHSDTISKLITINKYLIVGINSDKTIITPIGKTIHPFNASESYNLNINFDAISDLKFTVLNHHDMGGACVSLAEIKVEIISDNTELIGDSIYIKALNYGDTLKMNSHWGKKYFLILRVNRSCVWPLTTIFDGYWKDVNEKFIGFRINDKLGWIRCGLSNNEVLWLYDYAIER